MLIVASIFLTIFGAICFIAGWLNRGSFDRWKEEQDRRTLGRQVTKNL
jgi:hypothetical protein